MPSLSKRCAIFTLLFLSSAATADAPETSLSLEDGAEIEWADRRFVRFGGRIHYDIARFNDDVTPLANDQDFRRARVEMKGRYDDWQFRADYDVGIVEGWRNVYVRYRGWKRKRLTVGNQVTPFSLDDLVSSNDLTMMERSLASALSPGMLTGASLRTWGDNWSATAGVFGDELSDLDRRTAEGTSVIGRFTYAPVRKKRRVLHIGLAHEYRSIDSGGDVRIRTRPESRLTDERLISTDRLTGVDSLQTTGIELMGIVNNLRLQSEYVRMSVDGGLNDANFNGGYLQASWLITGERYRYSRSRGVPTAVRPRNEWGALELSARYSTLDLSDGEVSGGEQSQITAAASLHVNEHLKFSLNYSLYDAAPNRDGIDEDGSILMLRFQATL